MPILIIVPNPCLIPPSFEHLPRQCPEGHQKCAGRKTSKARRSWNALRMATRLLSAKSSRRGANGQAEIKRRPAYRVTDLLIVIASPVSLIVQPPTGRLRPA